MKTTMLISAEDSITQMGVDGSAASLVPTGSILTVVRSGILAHSVPFAIAGRPLTFNQDIKGIQVSSNRVTSDYVFWFLRSKEKEILSRGVKKGATVHSLQSGYLESLKIPLLEESEQSRIVDLLSRADNIVRMRREAEQNAKKITPALFVDIFGDPATNPRGWETSTLLESGAQIRYGIGQPLPQMENGTPFLRATNVKRGRISRDGLIYIDPAANPSVRNPPLRASDILVVRSGAYTGDVAQVGEDFEGAIAGYDLVVRPADGQSPEFLATYLLLPQVQQAHIHGNTIRAAQPHLNAKQLGGIPVPLVSPQTQKRFQKDCRDARSIEGSQTIATARAVQAFHSLLGGVFEEGMQR